MGLSGHCLCGQVKYTVDSDPLNVAYDHCDDCQRQTGSTYSLVVVVPESKISVTGPTKTYVGTGGSGQPVHRVFCGECGSPIYHDPKVAPIIALKAGTLSTEDKKALKPTTEIFAKDKLPFMTEKLENVFDTMPH
ncbi:glutathione-dependent formaldehyde-activating enzyme [Xylariaceae sp. FL1272]|nr:glutathione-dependent formaldehyde-activating enzyme [Xylariaceae sp. FL1272]